MDNSRCVVLVPVGHYLEPHCDLALRQLEALGYPVRRVYGFAQVDLARSRMATDAVAEGYDELMWVDSDMAFEPQSVTKLRAHGQPIVAGLYPKKVEKRLTSQLLPGTDRLTMGEGGGLIEIQYAATGFLYTRRQVYLDIQQRLSLPACALANGRTVVPYFLPMVLARGERHLYLGEDYAFCERARQCGYRVHADTSIRLQHIGMYGYGWEDLHGGLPRQPSCTLEVRRG
jgi:hypothetical protein